MKKILALYWSLLTLTFLANAASTTTQDAVSTEGFFSSRNLVVDGGFEKGDAVDWTASGGTKAIITSAVSRGSQSATWNSSSAGQTFRSKAVAIPVGMYGKNAVVTCDIGTGGAGTYTHTLGAYDGAANVGPQQTISVDNTGVAYRRNAVNFVMPSSGNIQLQLTSVAADETTIQLDDCGIILAEGYNISSVAQATFHGSLKYAATTNCIWSSSGSTATAFPADTDCPTASVTGRVTAPATKIPGFVVSEPGEYLVVASGAYFENTSASNGFTSLKLSDGTISSSVSLLPLVATTAYSGVSHGLGTYKFTKTDSSSSTFNFYQDTANATFTLNNSTTTAYDGAGLDFQVFRFPTQSETAYRADANASYYSGYHDSTCSWSLTSTSYTGFTADATCALTTRVSNGISATSVGSVTPALALTLQRTGTYYVCAIAQFKSSGAANNGLRLWDGTTVISEVGNDMTGNYTAGAMCGFYNATSLTPTLTIQGKSSANNTTISATGANSVVEWTIFPINANFPAPLLVGVRDSIFVDTGNGHGSTDTKVRILSNVRSSSGTCITRATNATNGDTYTVSCGGVYDIHVCDAISSGTPLTGISVNSSTLTTSIISMTYAQGYRAWGQGVTNGGVCANATLTLVPGDVVRMHDSGGTNNTDQLTFFSMTRVN